MKKPMFILLAALSMATAQAATTPTPTNNYLSGNITRTYNAEDLKTRSALLDVSIGDIWVLNLPDTVTDVITTKEGVFQFKQSGSTVILGALVTSGTYPVLVTTQDANYFFTVHLTGQKGGGMRNVNVTAVATEPTEEAAAPVTAPMALSSRPVTPSAQRPVATGAAASVRPTSTTSAATTPSVPSSTPSSAVMPVAPAAPADKPAAVPPPVSGPTSPAAAMAARVPSYQLEYRAMSNGVQTALYYHITNASDQPIMFDERALTLLGVGGKLPFVPAVAPKNIAPGKDVYGQITVLSTLKVMQAYWSPLGDAALDAKTINVESLNP